MFHPSEEMADIKTYYPVWGDVVALLSPEGTFVGGYKMQGDNLLLVGHCQEWEYFIFEGVPTKFRLKQKVSSNYISEGEESSDKPTLTDSREEATVFSIQTLPNGNLSITSQKGKKLSRLPMQDDYQLSLLKWSVKSTIFESWLFKLIDLRAAGAYPLQSQATLQSDSPVDSQVD